MIVVIPIEELEKEIQPYFRFGSVSNLSVDYATNAIHGYVGEKEYIVFRFKEWGIYLDNRYNSHIVTGGPAGILVKVSKVS